jgi:hypothetical protein
MGDRSIFVGVNRVFLESKRPAEPLDRFRSAAIAEAWNDVGHRLFRQYKHDVLLIRLFGCPLYEN